MSAIPLPGVVGCRPASGEARPLAPVRHRPVLRRDQLACAADVDTATPHSGAKSAAPAGCSQEFVHMAPVPQSRMASAITAEASRGELGRDAFPGSDGPLAACPSGRRTAGRRPPAALAAAPAPAVTRVRRPSPDWLRVHRGVSAWRAAGQAVYAAGAGVVVFAGPVAGPAGCLGGPRRRAAHLLRAGAPRSHQVARGPGKSFGTAGGRAGCPVAACLHWGAMWGPAARRLRRSVGLLATTLVRLKPLAGVIQALGWAWS